MAGDMLEDDDLLELLELPSSQIGPFENFSDDGDWNSDASVQDRADRDDIITQLSENDSDSDVSNEPIPPDLCDTPSTSKRARIPRQKKEPKNKTFKPKKKRIAKKPKKKTNKYPHVWNNDVFVPKIHHYDDTQSGIVSPHLYPDPCREIDCFEKMFPEETTNFIVDQTNRHYEYVTSNQAPTPKSRLTKWKPLTVEEFKVFLAITLLMVHNKKNVLENYWSTDKLQLNYIPNLMSRNRYCTILRLLHFSDNAQQNQHGRLSKIKDLVDMFRKTFSSNLIPFRNLCIDESLLKFKGRLSFKQFIPSKRSRFGIKTYVLCDCETGYVLDFIVYTGKDSEIYNTEDLGISGAIVTTLLTPYLNKGHLLFVDNWYSSPDLFTYLHLNKTNACGTVRGERLGMPQFQQELEVGQTETCNDTTSLVVRWVDKRQVLMITSEHVDEMVDSGKVHYQTAQKIMKPVCVQEYNFNMGSVDRSDMMLSYVESVRRTQKWYKKFFLHLIDLAVLNSHAIYLSKTGKKPTLQEFHLEIVRQLLEDNMQTQTPRQKTGGRPSPGDPPLRLTQRHFPTCVPSTDKKEYPTRQCHVCKHTSRREQARRESRYMCEDCGVALCVVPCFREYHTLKHY